MAKRYDPIMCMMVDEPTKAQDANKYVEQAIKWMKEGKDRLEILFGLQQMGLTPTDAAKYYAEAMTETGYKYRQKDAKAQDGILFYQLRFSSGRTEGAKLDESEIRSYAEALLEKYGEKQVAVSRQGKIVATYLNAKAYDSASALDKAIKTCDGMFQQIFGKYSSAAKQHYDRAVKELDSFKGEIKDYLTLAGKWEMQIRNDLTRIDEAYNTAGNDYYAARREIQETMDSLTQVMLRKAREKRK